MNLLLIDHSRATHEQLMKHLRAAGHMVTRLSDASALAAALGLFSCDAVLLGMEAASDDARSLDALRRLREVNERLPVIVISDRDSVEDRIRLLELGADDYLTAPCHPDELLARVQAKTRVQPQVYN